MFWINVPIAALLIPLAAARIAESRGRDTALDVPGMALVTGGCLGLVWGRLVHGNDSGWTNAVVVLPMAVGVVLVVAFVAWQRRAGAPMLPLYLFRDRTFSASSAAGFLLYAALYGTVFFLAQYLQIGLGYSPLDAGLWLIPRTATLLVVAPLAGVLADRFGNRPVLVAGLAIKAVGLGWLATMATSEAAFPILLTAVIVEGIGTSMAIPVVQSANAGRGRHPRHRQSRRGQQCQPGTRRRVRGGGAGRPVRVGRQLPFGRRVYRRLCDSDGDLRGVRSRAAVIAEGE